MNISEIIAHLWTEWFSIPPSVVKEEMDGALIIGSVLIGSLLIWVWGVIETIFFKGITKEKKKLYFWLGIVGIAMSIFTFVFFGVAHTTLE